MVSDPKVVDWPTLIVNAVAWALTLSNASNFAVVAGSHTLGRLTATGGEAGCIGAGIAADGGNGVVGACCTGGEPFCSHCCCSGGNGGDWIGAFCAKAAFDSVALPSARIASAAASLGGADAVAAFWVDSMPDGAAVHDALKAELGQKTVPYGEWLSIRCCTSKSAAHPLQLRLLQLLPNRRLHLSMQEAR